MEAPASRAAASRSSGVRRHNLSAVLELLHVRGPASRSQLAVATGLNRSTVADLVSELAGHGLVLEDGVSSRSGPGRPSPVVHVRAPGAIALAVELGVESVGVAAIGLGGHVLEHTRVDLVEARPSPQETVRMVAGLVDSLDASTADRRVGIGVAVPGLTRGADGFVHLAPNLGWRGVGLGTLLSDALGLPLDRIRVGNEADLGALGEHRRGAGRGADHLVFVSGEVGIGAGLIVAGRPMLGAAGYAGEAGHMLVDPGGRGCTCGSVGCWETRAGEAALLRAAGVRRVAGGSPVETVATRLARGDARAAAAVAEIGHWLGVGVGNLVNLLNPELVVLGGMFQRLFPHLRDPLLAVVRARALDELAEQVRIVPSALGTSAQLHGAAEVVLAATLADPVG